MTPSPQNGTDLFPGMPLKPFQRSSQNAASLQLILGYGPVGDSSDAATHGSSCRYCRL